VAACGTGACFTPKEPVDCVLSAWSYWDACSNSCNGVQMRTRHLATYPSSNGKPCESDLKEIR